MSGVEHSVGGVGCSSRSRWSGLGAHARALTVVLVISAVFMAVEVVGGVMANSLALLADAGHMLTDVAAVALALFVAWIARRPATPEKTYGYLRLEILLLSMRILHRGHSHSLNIRGAYLHVVSDLLGSVGAILAGVVILFTGWTPADPIISVLIAMLILGSAWRLVRESVDVLLEGTPPHISMKDVETQIAEITGVTDVHDLHVWTVTSGVVAMSGHVVVPDSGTSQQVLEAAQSRMAGLGIHHITVQIEQDPTCVEESGP
jgi:cobalt-zinc-cadmium efflux system protein